MRCREGIVDLSGRLSHERGVPQLQPRARNELVARYRELSAHDAWVYARQEGNHARAAVMWREAAVKNALEGHIFEAREMFSNAMGMLDGAGELVARKSLHALFIREARKVKQKSRGLSSEFVELAAELIEPVEREEAFKLRQEVAQYRRQLEQFLDAAYQPWHIAFVLRKEDPARAEEFIRAAITDLRGEAKKDEKFGRKANAELEIELARALSLLAELLEKRGSPEAATAYEEAGDHYLAGRNSSFESEEEMLGKARMNYRNAKRLGGDATILDERIDACEPEGMGCVVLTPEQGRDFMEHLARIEPFVSTDDKD